jgi:hypothetical protein
MKKSIKLGFWIKQEIIHITPVFVFFLISFLVINWAEGLMLKNIGYQPFSFWEILLAAALIAKILLVIDHLPLINLFLKKPLIFNVLWKTFFYCAVSLLVRLSIRLFPFLFTNESLVQEIETFNHWMNWNFFFGMTAYYLMLFFLFVTARELTMVLGPVKMRRLFFGR